MAKAAASSHRGARWRTREHLRAGHGDRPIVWLGAQHGAEIPYAFNWPNGAHSSQVRWTDADRRLADQVSSYWVNFATAGDPNGKNLPKWPAYQAKHDQAMGFGDSVAVISLPHKAALDFLDGYINRLRHTRTTRTPTGQ